MLASMAGAFAPAFPHDDARLARFLAEHKKLHQAARNLISASPRMVPLGTDPLVDQLLSAAGFAPYEVFAMRLAVKGEMLTAVCVPTRIWRDPDRRNLLLQLKRQAHQVGTRCVLVPQRYLRGTVRADVSRTLARYRHTSFSRADLNLVREHLGENGRSTLIRTAAVLAGHDDALGAVLAMTARGYVDIDRTAPIHKGSWTAVRY